MQDSYCVVLTGELEAGADPSDAWPAAAKLLGLDPSAFESEVLVRAPLALDGEGAAADMELRATALRESGVSAVCLRLGAPMVRIRRGERRLGPMPQPFAQRILGSGDVVEPVAQPGPMVATPGAAPVPPPPAEVWLSRAGANYGPYALSQLRSWVQDGTVSRMDFASTDRTAWVPLGSLLGAPTAPVGVPLVSQETADEATVRRIAEYERISAIVWAVIAVVQILSVVAIVAGAWNLYAAWTRHRIVPHIQARNQAVPAAFESITGLVIIGLINLFLGGVIGVIGVVFDFVVRDHVLKNRHLFDRESEEAMPA